MKQRFGLHIQHMRAKPKLSRVPMPFYTRKVGLVNKKMNIRRHLLRVTLYAEKIETVFPALFFYPEDGGRR